MKRLFVQGSSFCDIDCDYCFVRGRNDKARLSLDYLHDVYRIINNSETDVEIVWHMGEPLVLGFNFFKKVLEYIPVSEHIRHRIVTNGLLLNDDWLSFLADNCISLTISSDGPIEVHDRYRTSRKEAGTFEVVHKNLCRSIKKGVCDSVLCTITKESLSKAAQIYEYFSSVGVEYLGFNVERQLDSPEIQVLSLEKFDSLELFWKDLYEAWEKDSYSLFIREFYRTLSALNSDECPLQPDELKSNYNYSLSKNGDLYKYIPQIAGSDSLVSSPFFVGNVKNLNSFEETSELPVYSEMLNSQRLCSEKCDFYRFCGGAFVLEKLVENGMLNSTSTAACERQVIQLAKVVSRKHG
ncbi:radical SAM protein [Amphritea balenae]|uniref:Radical SAM protein n=1 Tax=Amphritea balenae TaxID=452629 RepID=A0A3P1SQ44_9GAMM|nr:radical SAM protein [Amphritea balenae]RRC98262.1 radical SAM protein [Amphritea balenae]GGK80475.1 anaerobic sulfatase maturase [Amphritea balenae]